MMHRQGPSVPRLCGLLLAVSAIAAPLARGQAGSQSADRVTVFASVVDGTGAFRPGLTAADFALKENGRARPIESLAIDTGRASLVLLLDRSGSVRSQLDAITRMAQGVVEQLGPDDRMQVADLDGVSPPRPATLTSDKAALRAAVAASASRSNATALWDRLAAAINRLSGEPGYRAVVIVSDGEDTVSRLGRSQAVALAQRSRVIVHAIDLPLSGAPATVNGRTQPITNTTHHRDAVRDNRGTRIPMPDATEGEAVTLIGAAVRQRYAITFLPRVNDGKSHDLELKALRKDLTVRIARRY